MRSTFPYSVSGGVGKEERSWTGDGLWGYVQKWINEWING